MQTERERQAKDQAARSVVGPQYLGRNDTDHTVTFSIGGKRWEYWLNPMQCLSVTHLAHRISSGKAFAFAKSHALKTERIPS